MAKDITQEFLLASSYSKNWSNQFVWKTLKKILELAQHCRIDWDEKAGEIWGLILNDTHTVAMVCTILPMVFYREDIIGDLDSTFNYDVVHIPVNSFDAKYLSLKKGIMAEMFGIDDIDIDSGENPFSVNDLYYSTV
jgi:hypothetical protein